jgi:DNA polymerase III subunit chi
MVEVLFYQLDRRPLEAVLPQLLERTLERGWRACVQAGSEERVEALSSALWTWRDEAFLPHGTARDGNGELQPIWLTAGEDNPNRAVVRFLVDGAVYQLALTTTHNPSLPGLIYYETARLAFALPQKGGGQGGG